MIEINDDFIEEYSKKIMGFAFLKTKDTYLAEDLAQEILFQLMSSLKKNPTIECMDSYVYTLCCYTWSKFLRSNKKHWGYKSLEGSFELADTKNISQAIEDKLMMEKIKEEISYLGKLHRKVTIMYYFENKKSTEIAEALNLKSSTVRWYLGEVRKQLKVGIEEKQDYLSYEPKYLECVVSGIMYDETLAGLKDNLLTQNIAVVCYGEPLSLTEISKRLGVAAAYIEGLLEKLVHMDYIKVIGTKYQTNFFIQTKRLEWIQAKYQLENIGSLANKIKQTVNVYLNDYKEILFCGQDISDDQLRWALICLLCDDLEREAKKILGGAVAEEKWPKRKDGSAHFIFAKIKEPSDSLDLQTEFNESVKKFSEYSQTKGIRLNDHQLATVKQYETWLSIQFQLRLADISDTTIHQLMRVKDLLLNHEELTEYDKLIVSEHIQKGYLKTENEQVKFLIPYFTANEFHTFEKIRRQMIEELGSDYFVHYIKQFSEVYENVIPNFLSKEIKQFEKYNISPLLGVVAWLIDTKALTIPSTEEEAKSFGVIIWEKEQALKIS